VVQTLLVSILLLQAHYKMDFQDGLTCKLVATAMDLRG